LRVTSQLGAGFKSQQHQAVEKGAVVYHFLVDLIPSILCSIQALPK
jgi:hypothetical protein